jgi:hypothetical protein
MFCTPNINIILDMLEGKPNVKKWNNIYNTSMHIMLKWDEGELCNYICLEMIADKFCNLLSKKELERCLIPKAGQHYCGGIPCFVHKFQKNPAQWQSILSSHRYLSMAKEFEEQPVAHYLSGPAPMR